MRSPLVSVILPFRNADRTLNDAIASIAHGTFADLELILIDNGSTDGSSAIAQEWTGKDPRIILLEEPRIGIAHALDLGLANSRGELIARMDADDVSHPDRIERQVAFMQKEPGIGVLGTRTIFRSIVEKSSGMEWFVQWQNAIISPHQHFVKRFIDVPLAHPTAMFRRELITKHGGYSTTPLPEDHELWLRWMDAGVLFAKLPEELLIWNDHPARSSRTHSNYSTENFYRTKVKWIARWLKRIIGDRYVIVAGTSRLCRDRASLLEAEGIPIAAFTDVRHREMPCHRFIAHDDLPPRGEAFIVSFISQRGTGDRIAEYFGSIGLTEGEDYILAA